MWHSLTKEIFKDFVSLFFPSYCLGCSGALMKGEDLVCTQCMLEMPQTNHHFDADNSLKARMKGRLRVNHVSALFKFSKDGRVQHLLHALKYKNYPEVGIVLGKVYAAKLQEIGVNNYDLVIPVPLHPARKRKRGYNQSAKFAEGLCDIFKIPFSDSIIERKIKTETQTRKSRLNRWENVREVFHVKNPEAIRAKRILLVDDVITTGATLEACGFALLEQGCLELGILCIAEA